MTHTIMDDNNPPNIYKISRTRSGLSQEKAAKRMGITARRLSDYENGKVRVPDDIVREMARLYNNRSLALEHLDYVGFLNGYMSEVVVPESPGDMVFRLILAQDKLVPVVETMKLSVENKQINGEATPEYEEAKGKLRDVIAYLLVASIYAG